MIPPRRPYQTDTIDWLRGHPRAIIGTAPGLGKTRVLVEHFGVDPGPVLVICCLRIALRAWRREIPKWLGDDVPVLYYHGTAAQRTRMRPQLATWRTGYVLCTSKALAEIRAAHPGPWAAIVIDEAHYVAGRKSATFKQLLALRSQQFYWVSGNYSATTHDPVPGEAGHTLVVTSPAELWVPMTLIDRRRFRSYWRWVGEHCWLEKDELGHMRVFGTQNVAYTRRVLEPYYYATAKTDVQDQLPPKNRYGVHVELTAEQRRLYNELEQQMLTEVNSGQFLVAASALAVATRLRQVLVTPELLPGWEGPAESGAFEVFTEVRDELDAGNAVVAFTPFARALPIFERELHKLYPHLLVGLMHGGLSANAQAATTDAFQQHDGPKVLLCTIRSAASFDAYSACVVYFFGYDWDPRYNVQAEDRVHRLGQVRSVDVRYVLYEGTIDEYVLDVNDEKMSWADAFRRVA